MLIYEVNLKADEKIATEFEAWLDQHVQDMLKLDEIENAHYFKVHESPNEFVAHYRIADFEQLVSYYQNHADEMRADALEKFPEQFSAQRRVLVYGSN